MTSHDENDSARAERPADHTSQCNRFISKLGAASQLSSVEEDALSELCRDVRSIEARRHIIRQGDNPHHIHIILDGWAARYKVHKSGTRQIVAILLPGDICDQHVAILNRMDHSIVTLTHCEVAFVPARKLEDAIVERPEVARALWRATLIDESVLRAWIANVSGQRGAQRIGHLFCELYARMRLIGLVDGGVFALPLTQEVIADATGMTPVHVNRILRDLRADGLIDLIKGHLHIRDVQKLQKYSGFDVLYLHPEQLISSAPRLVVDNLP